MRRLVYVSGKLGAGKTSLAFPLAAELGYSLVTKDLVKETLYDALHVPGEGEIDRAWSRRLGGASMELLFALAARAGDMERYDRPVGIGSLITVDTTAPVDVAAVAAKVRRLHGRTGPRR